MLIQTFSNKNVLLPIERQCVHFILWLAISYSFAHLGPFSLHRTSKVHLTSTNCSSFYTGRGNFLHQIFAWETVIL